MPETVPSVTDVRELAEFISLRVNEEHDAALADETLEPEAQARFFRVSNSNKHGLAGTAESILFHLDQDNAEAAERAWHLLTGAGEQWRDHPDFLPTWQNPQLASVRQALGA
ncbi:hypothetical protein ABR738_00025 [Streptomyces sp. Edi4]|uniref:hypothetical protein n=1 Tax=Streptomyces sp. Edi4 TaxID=3162527 RepID=UPI003305F3D8